ncbi:mannose-1-phosphate guanylyltransferase/mannose-6-phosphate isomerase [Paracidovorax anthurii]|uniref:mannose-1-phosphate guanylyltransferase n=1 Tax=Paracidovorax anthurii TaxID=78229 RepID=A0A328Z3Y6_9BURK|nr:mannose-1-phosphate guanylyltransferase/mannose-6-phosphate isomerase [Paracidovorax anthurii]RAR76966.1 mannose-1-phosphate guanylyltransferase/mannose-6-phosphate isomerase [Paracidovorax anthurii]
MTDQLLSVILCGGSGTRLWPLSRETYPKQFLSLTGPQTMLQQTALRLAGLGSDIAMAPSPMLVCNKEHRFLAASQLMAVGIQKARILLEPCGRNTAPALTLAALQALADGADPVMLVMPADHAMADLPAFHAAVRTAFPHACAGAMITFGIVADRAETGYGYIRRGVPQGPGVDRIASFAEKPDAERAQRYLDSGDYLWNSGLFMVRASVWLSAIDHCRPDIAAACRTALQDAQHDLDFIRPADAAFMACPSDSIDYAVMERLPQQLQLGIPACVVPMSVGWSDVGAWQAVWDASERDERSNAIIGDVVAHDCEQSFILSSSRLVAGVGLDHIVVIETPDAVLVADKRRTQEVKQIVETLRDSGHVLAQNHRKMHRPWGWYDAIDHGDRFQVKRIVVNPGASLSLQKHHHRAEHWVVVKGTAEVTKGDETFLLGENESTYIPLGHVHRLANPGKVPLEIIEVQSGSYLGEDDIVRLQDTYGR